MTEDEMKLTWCPFARSMPAIGGSKLRQGYGSFNRVHDPEDKGHGWPVSCACLGRACSQWRWDDVPNPAYAEWKLTHRNTMMLYYDEAPPSSLKSTTDGHCGQAGRP